MLVKDYDLGFTFEIDDQFTEISRDKYQIFDVDEDTLHYFLYLDEESNEYPFAIIKGKKCADIKEYEEELVKEVNELSDLYTEANVSAIFTIQVEGSRRLDRVSIDFKDGGYMTVVYFTYINGYIVTASTSIERDADDYEGSVFRIFNSMREIK